MMSRHSVVAAVLLVDPSAHARVRQHWAVADRRSEPQPRRSRWVGRYTHRWWAPLGQMAPVASVGFILVIGDWPGWARAVGAALLVGYLAFAAFIVVRRRP